MTTMIKNPAPVQVPAGSKKKKIAGTKKKTPGKRIFRPAPGLEDRYPGTQRRVA
jgi:hypothetical protein